MGKNKEKPKCLICELPSAMRGLCRNHYQKFIRQKNAAVESGITAKTFEEESVKAGLILPDSRFEPLLNDNPFSELLNKLQNEQQKPTESSKDIADREANEIKIRREKPTKQTNKRKKVE
jgi:hypothetical protein